MFCLVERLSPKMTFCHNCCKDISWEILVLGLSHHLMTTPNITIPEPYKHLTIAKAHIARQIAPWRKHRIWVWSVSDVSSWIQVQAVLPC